MGDFLLALLMGLSLFFVVYTIVSLLFFSKRFLGHPTGRPPKSQNNEDYDDDVVTVKRVNFITEKLFEAGVETGRLAKKLIFLFFVFPTISYLIIQILLSKIKDDIIILSKNYSLENIQKIESLSKFLTKFWEVLDYVIWIYGVVGIILIIQNIYVIATILKETKKYFKFDSTKISSRSKDPYFNR